MADKQQQYRVTVADQPIALAPAEVEIPASEGDFLVLEVRAISARIIPGHWFEFPADLLQGATAQLKGMPVMLNHWHYVDTVVGMVLETWWDEEARLGAPGINARLRLDKQSLPEGLLRQMTADPPFKCAVSITWFGEYAKSHPDLTASEFYALLGEKHQGQVVRWIATKIDEMPELSLVWAGADRGARALAHPGTNANLGQPGGQPDERSTDMAETKNIVTLAALAPLGQALALTPIQMGNPEEVVQHLQAGVDKLRAKVAELEPLAQAGQAHLEAVRTEALRLAALGAQDHKVAAGLEAVIKGADLATATAFLEQFGGKVGQTFKAVCPSCGKEVPIRSSLETEKPPEQLGAQDQPEKTGQSMADRVNQAG
ncbi:MAG: hypothetical protein KKC30_15685 [Proteobacteria bacterium]|nr:hypothetical protein [Pseudomonadota bacterium]MBU4381574.1 hypothetical protein [Pseudomonadota bacterium]MCG2766560.1 hypothetical protein [Desulfarculaceae bacterium]